MNVSIRNINSPTRPFWTKIQAASIFISSTIMGTALATDNHIMGWTSFGLTILAGLIPIFTNGPLPIPLPKPEVHETTPNP